VCCLSRVTCCTRRDLQLIDNDDDGRSGGGFQLRDDEQLPIDVASPAGADEHDGRHFGQLLRQRRLSVVLTLCHSVDQSINQSVSQSVSQSFISPESSAVKIITSCIA